MTAIYLGKNGPKFHRMFKKKNYMVLPVHSGTGQLAFVSSFHASVSMSTDGSVAFQTNDFHSRL